MSYKYTLSMLSGVDEGYVKFNITPSLNTPLSPGESFTIKGQYYCRDAATYGIKCMVGNELDAYNFVLNGISAGSVTSSKVAAKKVKAFTLTGTIPSGIDSFGLTRNLNLYFSFSLITSSDGMSGAGVRGSSSIYFNALKYRQPPEISSFVLFDSMTYSGKTAFSYFGSFVQNRSVLAAIDSITTDPLDSSTSIVSKTLTLNGTTYELSGNNYDICSLSASGKYSYVFRVVDNKGMQSVRTGEITVLPYSKPLILDFTLDRYTSVIQDDGTYRDVLSDDGENVFVNFAGRVQAIAGKNAFTVTLSAFDGTTTNIVNALSGNDGSYFDYKNNKTIYSTNVSSAKDYIFTLTVRDWFGENQESVCYISKSENLFVIEDIGVAVGMPPSGSLSDRRFEVAENYNIYLNGEIKRIGKGWTDLTTSKYLLSGTSPASLGGGVLRCRKIEDRCIIAGSVLIKPGANSTVAIARLPDGYTPSSGVFSINACYGSRIARIVVGGKADGGDNVGCLCLSWVKNLTDGTNYSSSEIWVQCSIEYWVDDISDANNIPDESDSTLAILGIAKLGKMRLGVG